MKKTGKKARQEYQAAKGYVEYLADAIDARKAMIAQSKRYYNIVSAGYLVLSYKMARDKHWLSYCEKSFKLWKRGLANLENADSSDLFMQGFWECDAAMRELQQYYAAIGKTLPEWK